ncbi:MAG: RES family NAD+ phosphorylase [Desulforhopalus sp.]
MNYYCWKCFEDYAINDFIKENGSRGNCSHCGCRSKKVMSAKKIGHFVRTGFHNAYEHVEESGMYWVPGYGYTSETPAADHLYEEVVAAGDNIVDDLIASSGPSMKDIMDGDDDPLDGGMAFYVVRNESHGRIENSFAGAWSYFKFHVTHRWRFFDKDEAAKRASILQPLTDHILSLEETIPAGREFFRARVERKELPTEPPKIQKYIGPPPNRSSSHNRMSPAGIPYFYVSSDPETSIAEISPNVGEKVVVGKFKNMRGLKVLDLTSVPSIPVPSIFDPSYDHSLRWAKDFAQDFIKELSKPYNKHDTLIDYIPTQVLSEFIRSNGYDGLKFNSSQNPGGVNYTFFCGPEHEHSHYDSHAGITEFIGWFYLEEVETKRIERLVLSHSQLNNQSFTRKQVTPPPPRSPF